MSMMLAVLPGCQLLNLDTTYEAHYKKAEYQIKEKTISDRWKSKASQVGVVSKKEADHIIM